MEQTGAEALPGGKPDFKGLEAESATPAVADRAPEVDMPDRMPADLAELATLWDQVPEAIRQSWLLIAKALAKGRP